MCKTHSWRVHGQWYLTFWDPVDWNLPGSSVHGISQARILEQVAISFSRGSAWLRDRILISYIGSQILHHGVTWEAPASLSLP